MEENEILHGQGHSQVREKEKYRLTTKKELAIKAIVLEGRHRNRKERQNLQKRNNKKSQQMPVRDTM